MRLQIEGAPGIGFVSCEDGGGTFEVEGFIVLRYLPRVLEKLESKTIKVETNWVVLVDLSIMKAWSKI